jgi:GH18 family chitinase
MILCVRHRLRIVVQVARAPSSRVASTWFAGWHADAGDFPPEDLSWEKYTTVTYAFALTNPDPADLTMSSQDDSILRRVVQLGHATVRQFRFVLLFISIYFIRRFRRPREQK